MTLPATARRAGPLLGNGVATDLPFDFKVFAATDLQVVKVITATGVESTLVLDSDYIVTLNPDQATEPGGVVQYAVGGVVTPLPAGESITIIGALEFNQPLNLPSGGSFSPRALENELDRQVMLLQQAAEMLNRALLFTPTDAVGATLPAAAARADRLLGFDSTGRPIVVAPTDGSSAALAADIANAAQAVKGGGQVGYNALLAYVAGTIGHKLNRFLTPEDFGAVGNFVPASGTGTDDTAAVQAFFTYLAANGGLGILPRRYKVTTPITLTSPARGFRVTGAGWGTSGIYLRATTNGNTVNLVNPSDITLDGFTLENGYTATGFGGHCISIRNPQRVTVRDVYSADFMNSGGIMFADTVDTYSDNHFVSCTAEGGTVGQNGYLLVDMLHSTIDRCRALNLSASGSPCYGLQLKNECRDCRIIEGYAEGCKGGIVFASDATLGPDLCFASGTVRDCVDGVLLGKTTRSQVRAIVDGANNSALSNAVEIGASCSFNDVRVTIDNMHASLNAILVRSDDNQVTVERAGTYGSKLLELTAGVDRCRLYIDNLDGDVANAADLVLDNSGTTSNEVFYRRDSRGGTLSGTSLLFMRGVADADNYISLLHSSDSWTVRSGGVDRLFIQPTTHNPGTDNAVDSGSAVRRWANIRAASSTILTSDEREKQQIGAIPDTWLDAWADVEWSRYKWTASVVEKGDAASRWHVGLIAQRVQQAFAARGLDAVDLGLLCYDEWPTQYGSDGEEIAPAGNRYGVRYDEAFALEAALTRRELQRLKNPTP